MEFALTMIFGTTQRDMFRQRAMGLIMVLVFIAAVLFVVGANSALAASPGAGVVGTIAGAIALVALMIAIYRFVPNRTFALNDVWPGGVLAGVLVEVFSLLFPLYAKVSKRLRYLRAAVRALLSARGLVGIHESVHPHRRRLQQAASWRSAARGDRGLAAENSREHRDPHSVIEAHRARSATAGRRAASGARCRQDAAGYNRARPITLRAETRKGPPPKAGGGPFS